MQKLKKVAAALVLLTVATAAAQSTIGPRQRRARRETNASREARIARTIQQEYSHKYEFFGGGGFMRFRSGDYTKKNNEVSWNAGAARFLSPKVAVIATAQGSFGEANTTVDNSFGVFKPQINEYFFQGGGLYRFYMREKVAVSAQAQAGVGWGIFGGDSKGFTPQSLGLWPDGFRPSFEAGVNLDYNFYPNLAFRVTPNYQGSAFGDKIQNNLGFNAGIVYRWGQQ
jgi:hypothetical protein